MGVTDTGRTQEVKQFDESKLGVKGLVNSGLTSIPPLFIHPPETLSDLGPARPSSDSIPTIDLSGCDSGHRPSVVEEVGCAARGLGFFQVVNHGVPPEVLDRTIAAVKALHEQPAEVKARIYRREMETGVAFFSNLDLFHSKAARWRLEPKGHMKEIPEVCRNEVMEWDQQVRQLGGLLMGLLSEGLGLSPGKLPELTCLETRAMVCGLQVKHGNEWVDVTPVPGALVTMSNDEYKSMDHRVLVNPNQEPCVSVAVFCNLSNRENEFGPFPEIISLDKPAAFWQFNLNEYMRRFFTKELEGKSLINYFRA
ncbi:hypothetical protein ACJRO7_012070 [Eucalyptus globulus]|uniref:Fe2OG dioxygenase domain-containing protein n=1 Tax=Eucalyptus globulus TaxID=34317 RepID=A0ABD3LHA7_EUCGL